MPPIVGIDLGTTNSLCAVFEEDAPRLIPNAHGQLLTPSVVGLTSAGQILVGSAALELRVTQPERCVATFKRWMGSDRRVVLVGREFTPPELSSLVLKSLKHDAESYLGQPVDEAVITVPAYFNDHQRQATRLAGTLAGLSVRRIVNEPTAAAMTYGFHDRQAEKKLLVIDLGGGTFDVTLMEVFEGTLEIVATAGESQLGGEDFTERLMALVLRQQGHSLEATELQAPLRVARLRRLCESAKRELFSQETARVTVPNEQGEVGPGAAQLVISRAQFAEAAQSLVRRLGGPIRQVLRDGRCPVEGLDEVLLVGGATRMEVVRQFVSELTGREPLCRHNPDEVVALGAAVQAALIEGSQAVDDLVMTDVCPFTLGVEVSKAFGHHHQEGYYLPIIHRNTTIPVSREEIVFTMQANQTEVLVRVFQGEARRVKDNLALGELRVTGIPPGPAGQPVCIRFTYDLNGLLEVEALVPETGKRFQTVLTNHAPGMTPREVAAAVERMQQVKFYPRDDLANQRLLRLAERAVGEAPPHQRETLEMAIDEFERAMSSGDREHFESARSMLLTTLSSLGIGDDEHPAADAGF